MQLVQFNEHEELRVCRDNRGRGGGLSRDGVAVLRSLVVSFSVGPHVEDLKDLNEGCEGHESDWDAEHDIFRDVGGQAGLRKRDSSAVESGRDDVGLHLSRDAANLKPVVVNPVADVGKEGHKTENPRHFVDVLEGHNADPD